jgi:hypothetical protein
MVDGLYPGMNFYAPNLLNSDMEKITFRQNQKILQRMGCGANMCVAAVGNFDSDIRLSSSSQKLFLSAQEKKRNQSNLPRPGSPDL